MNPPVVNPPVVNPPVVNPLATASATRTVLAALAHSGKRVRLYLGDPETGRDWAEENDVTGYVGRSTGTDPILILLRTRRSSGGGGILVANVLRILVDGRETYRHTRYRPAAWECRKGDEPGLPFEVWLVDAPTGGGLRARFATETARARWLAFMYGERATK